MTFKHSGIARALPFSFSSMVLAATVSGPAFAATVDLPQFDDSSNYVVIHATDDGTKTFAPGSGSGSPGDNGRSAFGRINPTNGNPASAPSISGPVGGSNAQVLPDGNQAPVAGLGGNIAIIDRFGNDVGANFSTNDVYSTTYGPGNGVDCGGSCDQPSSTSNSNFFVEGTGQPLAPNDPPVNTDVSTQQIDITAGNGINEDQDLSGVFDEMLALKSWLGDVRAHNAYTGVLDLDVDGKGLNAGGTPIQNGSNGEINNFNQTDAESGNPDDFLLSQWVDLVDGLNVIDVRTGDAAFNITNSNFIIDDAGIEGGDEDFFIFLVEDNQIMDIGNSRIFVDTTVGLNNTLFITQTDREDGFVFNNVEVNGIAFWDLSMKADTNSFFDGNINVNNLRGCGQWVAGTHNDWNDFSVDRCAFGGTPPNVIPVPAGMFLLPAGLVLLGALRRRRRT